MRWIPILFLVLLSGCAKHYWEGRAYEEKVKALTHGDDLKKLPYCDEIKKQQECIVR